MIMMQYLVEEAVELLNYFPSKNSVSETIIPSIVVEGKGKIDMGLKSI